MRLLICGSRVWSPKRHLIIKSIINGIKEVAEDEEFTVISGGARGPDSIAAETCEEFDIDFEEYPANWDAFGKRAGIIRNEQMLNTGIDLVVAFSDDIENSRGTKHMCNIAWKKGVPVYVVSSYEYTD